MASLVDTTNTSSHCTPNNLYQLKHKFTVPMSSVVQPGPAVTLPTILTSTFIYSPFTVLTRDQQRGTIHCLRYSIISSQCTLGEHINC